LITSDVSGRPAGFREGELALARTGATLANCVPPFTWTYARCNKPCSLSNTLNGFAKHPSLGIEGGLSDYADCGCGLGEGFGNWVKGLGIGLRGVYFVKGLGIGLRVWGLG